MRLPRKPRPPGDIDVTSFSDLAFLMIIFFVLTTTFVRPTGSKVTIPSSTSDPEKKPGTELPTVNIGRDRLVFNKTEVTLDRLRRELDDLKLPGKKDDERFVVVDTARDVPFQRYYEVVTAIARAGGVLALVEQVEESKSP